MDDEDANGYKELLSHWAGNHYLYKILLTADGKPRAFLVVDPGPGRLLGGRIDPHEGFISNNTDANGDGISDDKDNIYKQ